MDAAKAFSITIVGTLFDGKIRQGVIYRLDRAPLSPVRYKYLVVSDSAEGSPDIVMIKDFHKVTEKLKKKLKKGTGLEITVAPMRKMDAARVAKWFESIRELYSFCHSSKCQLIFSSGAFSMNEMVSGPCFDAILRNCDIDPERHWREMTRWVETRLSRKVSI